jgi:hypothetical protein
MQGRQSFTRTFAVRPFASCDSGTFEHTCQVPLNIARHGSSCSKHAYTKICWPAALNASTPAALAASLSSSRPAASSTDWPAAIYLLPARTAPAAAAAAAAAPACAAAGCCCCCCCSAKAGSRLRCKYSCAVWRARRSSAAAAEKITHTTTIAG